MGADVATPDAAETRAAKDVSPAIVFEDAGFVCMSAEESDKGALNAEEPEHDNEDREAGPDAVSCDIESGPWRLTAPVEVCCNVPPNVMLFVDTSLKTTSDCIVID